MAKQQKRKRRPQIKINTFCRFTAAGVKILNCSSIGGLFSDLKCWFALLPVMCFYTALLAVVLF
jgi:hypothetical protein